MNVVPGWWSLAELSVYPRAAVLTITERGEKNNNVGPKPTIINDFYQKQDLPTELYWNLCTM